MADWTPGPWEAAGADEVYGPTVLARGKGEFGDVVIAACSDWKNEGAGNARLIAEAPAMAALLDDIESAPFTAVGYEYRERVSVLLDRIRG